MSDRVTVVEDALDAYLAGAAATAAALAPDAEVASGRTAAAVGWSRRWASAWRWRWSVP